MKWIATQGCRQYPGRECRRQAVQVVYLGGSAPSRPSRGAPVPDEPKNSGRQDR